MCRGRTGLIAAVAAVLLLPALHALAEPVDAINAARWQGCAGRPGVSTEFRQDRKLRQAARQLARGANLQEALSKAGYRAVKSASMKLSGIESEAEMVRAVASRFCEQLIDPELTEAGSYKRGDTVWILLAARFTPPPNPGEASRRVLQLINDARSKPRRCGGKPFPAAPPLTLDAQLEQAALTHARDMARKGVMSHNGSDGSTPAERATRAGYKWRLVGENVAMGQTSPEEVVESWLSSPGHCANIMEPQFTQMGVAYAVDSSSEGGIYWAQVFGVPR